MKNKTIDTHFKKFKDNLKADYVTDQINNSIRIAKKENDPVNHPSHYTDGKIEVIDFIEDKKLCFHLGNTVKYVARAGKKDRSKTIQDLEKAAWYLNRKINQLKKIV